MSRIPSNNLPSTNSPSEGGNKPTGLRELDMDQFLQLLITELQNQDPLNPMENTEILQQIGQIREIGATNQLTETLDGISTGQNLATASGLIGKQVAALTDRQEEVQGVVDRVSVDVDKETENRSLRVHVGEHSVQLKNIRGIVTPQSDDESLTN